MFENHIAHARDMLDRLIQQKASIPGSTGVPQAELSAWYDGIYVAITNQYGETSPQLAAFLEVNQKARAYRDSWNRRVSSGEVADENFVGGYIGYLQTMIGHLLSFREEPQRSEVTLEWLSKNVPAKLWLSAIGILAATFVAGLQASRVEWIRQLAGLP